MTEPTFEECFAWIEKFHGKQKQLDPQVRVQWRSDFGKEHDEVFVEASHYATEKLPPGMFPTLERMRGFITEAREKLWQKVKDKEPKAPLSKPAPDYRNVPHGIEALALIKKISDQGYTDEVMDQLEQLGTRYIVWQQDWKAERAACEEIRKNIARRWAEPQREEKVIEPVKREFASADEKHEFYQKLFTEAAVPEVPRAVSAVPHGTSETIGTRSMERGAAASGTGEAVKQEQVDR